MIRLDNISKQHGHQILFIDASMGLQKGEKAGLVGPNGAGKSTLFRMIAGQEQPDDGQVTIDPGMTIGYFSQDVGEMSGMSAVAAVMDGVGPVSALADEIAELALARFIDPKTGYLREFFDGDWAPMSGQDGRIVEPGHLFEWAWLLVRWGRLRRRDDAIAAARRMAEAAERTGVDPVRGVAVNAILDDGSPLDPGARMWPQTERIKAATALAAVASTDAERALWRGRIAAGIAALLTYLDVPVAGLWRDKLQPGGRFVEEPAPASTFYHIICAIEETDRALAG